MSFSCTYSAQPHYLLGQMVSIEVDVSRGLHSFAIIGMASRSVDEARDRISSAIKNSGYQSPKSRNEKVVIALAPAELKKDGAYHDMAMTLSYLLAIDEISFDPENKMFIGELSLDGSVRGVQGVLPLVQTALKNKCTEVYVPEANVEEALLVSGLTVFGVKKLSDVINHVNQKTKGMKSLEPASKKIEKNLSAPLFDLSLVKGQDHAKRGLEIAATGSHNIVLYGPPGTGKTMLAKALSSLLPHLNPAHSLEVTGIHSVAGVLNSPVIVNPPFRNPHHTSSYVAILGGGAKIRPGEVTLAHRGVLFLDEFPEFDKRVIESLRQPLEDKSISIARAVGTVCFPADIMLIAAMNPCPCGFHGSLHKSCRCSAHEVERYRKKISGPITDRIDMWISVEHVPYTRLSSLDASESSFEIKKRVISGRNFKHKRPQAHDLSVAVKSLLEKSAEALKLSPRSFYKTIDLARTIADMDASSEIQEKHLLEALQYRPKIYG